MYITSVHWRKLSKRRRAQSEGKGIIQVKQRNLEPGRERFCSGCLHSAIKASRSVVYVSSSLCPTFVSNAEGLLSIFLACHFGEGERWRGGRLQYLDLTDVHQCLPSFLREAQKPTSFIDEAILSEVGANAITISQKRFVYCEFFSQLAHTHTDLPYELSWELGTLTEALLEYSWPRLSVFNGNASIPPSRELLTSGYPAEVINIATTCAPGRSPPDLKHNTNLSLPRIIQNKTNDSLALMPGDGAVGDPASALVPFGL